MKLGWSREEPMLMTNMDTHGWNSFHILPPFPLSVNKEREKKKTLEETTET